MASAPPSWPPRFAVAALLVLALAGCASDSRDQAPAAVEIPHPPLDGLEPPLARELESRRLELEKLFENEESSSADRGQALGELGRLYQAHRLLEAALACFREAHALDPDSFSWAYHLGTLAASSGGAEVASAAFGRALELKPEDAPTLIRLADLELDRGRLEAAAEFYERAGAQDDSAAAAYGLGRVAAERDRHEDALAHFEHALELQPAATVIHYHRGQAYRELGELERAEEALARSGKLKVAMRDPLMHELTELAIGASPHLSRGNAAVREGRLADAEREYRLAVGADAENPRARQSLATVLIRLGDAGGAVEQLVAATRLEPENARAQSDLGALLGELGDNERALEHLRRAVELEPELAKAHFNLGNTQARLRRFDEAIASFRTVLTQDPGHSEARSRLAAALAETGDYAQAAGELRLLLDDPPPSQRRAGVHFRLAEALARDGQLEEALSHYTRVRELEPEGQLAWLREATVLMGLGRFAASKELLEARLSVEPEDSRAAQALARVLASAPEAALRDGPRALVMAVEMLEADNAPAHAETAAMALAQVGRFTEAVDIQRQLVGEARRLGRAGDESRLVRNLELYERGAPCCARVADTLPPY